MLMFTIFLGLSYMFRSDVAAKATFEDCGGADKKIAILSGLVKPDPILYPGNVNVSASINVLKDLPASGFQMLLKLIKLDPYEMPVPCLKDIGSCSYDVCEMIENHKDIFCPMFPSTAKCGCPIKTGIYALKDAPVEIPNFGEVFVKILQGHYKGTISFKDTNTNTEVACIAVTFKIDPSK